MADWSLPTLGSNITTTFLSEVKNRDIDLALQFDGTTTTSIPTGAIRWTSSANTWQRWTGSAWGALSSTFAFPAITVSGNVSAAAFIPTGGTAPTNGMYLAGTGQVGIAAGGFTPLLLEPGTIVIPGSSVGSVIKLGKGLASNQYTYIDLASDTTYTDYGLRLIRENTGASTSSLLLHRGTGALNICAQDAGSVTLSTNNLTRVYVAPSTGNVGIGTSSPGYKLDVKGSVGSSMGTGTGPGGAGYALYQFGSSATATENWHIGSEGDGSFRFYNQSVGAGVERLRIGSSGQLGLSGANYGTIGQAQISQGASAPPTWGFVAFADVASKPTTLAGYGITDAQPKLASGASVASTSGTAIDFTGIPSWAKRITVMFNGVSTNGTSNLLIQVGAGSVANTGYTSQAGNRGGEASATNGFLATNSIAAISSIGGNYVLTLLGSNTWTGSGVFNGGTGIPNIAAGSFTLSGTLDRVRITTANGTEAFDAGTINILYE